MEWGAPLHGHFKSVSLEVSSSVFTPTKVLGTKPLAVTNAQEFGRIHLRS